MGFPQQPLDVADIGKAGRGCTAKTDIQAGETVLRIPENFTVTSVDVANHPVVAAPAEGRGDLAGLALWLLYERSLGASSVWHAYLKVFPDTTLSPLLWTPAEQEELLKGSPVLEEVKERLQTLEAEYVAIKASFFDADTAKFPPEVFTLDNFKRAFAVVLSRVVYLPSADVLALVPFADFLNHDGSSKSSLDYNASDATVVLVADRSYQKGEQVLTSYGSTRPNSDLLISYGFVDDSNKSDFVLIQLALVEMDRLYEVKKQLAADAGFGPKQAFPLYPDRFPAQLLTYMRLARIQDPALFSKVAFERDALVDQANEYEVLSLLLSECRDRFAAYSSTLEDDLRLLNRKDLSAKERVAAQLRVAEKRIVSNTITALRTRMAPIRGVPTKGGTLKDPNSDIKEMFDIMEQGLSAPKRFFSDFLGKPKK